MYENQVCEMEIINEVLKIKHVILEGEHESDSVLLDSLSRLQLVDLSYFTLKTTMIGKTVCVLVKSGRTMQIRLLARALVKKWKRVVDVAILDGTIKKVYQEKEEEIINDERKQAKKEKELLEKPKKAFIQNKDSAIQETRKAPTEIGSKPKKILIRIKTLVQEDKRKSPDKIESEQNIRKVLIQKRSLAQKDLRKALNALGHKEKVNKALVQKKAPVQENNRKAPIEMNSQSKTKKPFLQEDRKKALYEIKSLKESKKALSIQKKPLLQEDNLKCVDEPTRLEAARKRLRENYEQTENAKRQRRIQVVELHNLPNEVLCQTKSFMKRKGASTNALLECRRV